MYCIPTCITAYDDVCCIAFVLDWDILFTDLPLCIDTEDFALTTSTEEVTYSSSSIGSKVDDNSLACISASLPGVRWIILMGLSFFF